MQYQVRLVNQHQPIHVEATEFHFNQGAVVFFAERNRASGAGLNDQWGNPRMQRVRATVAAFSNVESVVEIHEVDPGIPEQTVEGFHENAIPFEARIERLEPFNWGNATLNTVPRGIGVAADEDGINWEEAQRDE
jgi:hypothetical protein